MFKKFFHLCFCIPFFLSALEPIEETITILSVNDVYETDAIDGLGGLAELATMFREQKAQAKYVFTTLNGDFLSPSVLSTHFQGRQMVDIFNAIPIDYVVFGNHEFDFGPKVLKDCMDRSAFKWLGTNVKNLDGSLFHTAIATDILNYGELKVGLFGVITPKTRELSKAGDHVIFQDVIPSSKKAVELLKEKGADVIIALTHLTIYEDRQLAEAVPEINVILGGHEHIPITCFMGNTLIHKSGYDGRYLVRIDLHVNKKENSVFVIPEWKMLPNRFDEKAPEIAELITSYKREFKEDLSSKLCFLKTPMTSENRKVRTTETAIGNLFADAILSLTGADCVFLNGGTIRGDTNYPQEISLKKQDILRELPFSNVSHIVKISGEALLAALELGLSGADTLQGGFPQVAGIKLSYNLEANVRGERIQKVFIQGCPLDPHKEYTLVITDYMSKGGDGFKMFIDLPIVTHEQGGRNLYSLVCDYLDLQDEVAPVVEGRLEKITR